MLTTSDVVINYEVPKLFFAGETGDTKFASAIRV